MPIEFPNPHCAKCWDYDAEAETCGTGGYCCYREFKNKEVK